MNKIYLFGHRQPDTDSIASVIGYAEFKNLSEPGKYIPVRCGELNPESRYVLKRFSIPEPVLLTSVKPTLSDISYKPVFSLPLNVPAVDVASLMAREGIRNIVMTDGKGKPVGIIGEHALAGTCIQAIHLHELAIMPLSPDSLARILDAKVHVSAREVLDGRVHIVIDAPYITLGRMSSEDIAVIGDNEPGQHALISAGVACLIVANGAPVGENIAAAAKERSVCLLSTSLDAFGIGRRINLSLPASEIMETDVPVLSLTDTIAHARQVVSSSKFRAACVVAADGTLTGILTRTTLLDDVRRSVILLDHNEASQSVDGIEEADIVEIIDHHRLGAITTLKPIRFFNDPVGATSTIIAMKFMESGLTPAVPVAGVLLCGILSDTLSLKMSTTTHRDIQAVKFLARITGEDPDQLGGFLIEQGMDLSGVSLDSILTRDLKEYVLSRKKVLISQVMVPSFTWNHERGGVIQTELGRLKTLYGSDIVLVLFTNFTEKSSELYGLAEPGLLPAIFKEDLPVRLEGVMSRKLDFLPWFGAQLQNQTRP